MMGKEIVEHCEELIKYCTGASEEEFQGYLKVFKDNETYKRMVCGMRYCSKLWLDYIKRREQHDNGEISEADFMFYEGYFFGVVDTISDQIKMMLPAFPMIKKVTGREPFELLRQH